MSDLISGDNDGVERAVFLLGDDAPVALSMARIAIAVEPRLHCATACENALNLLAVYDLSFRTLTGRA